MITDDGRSWSMMLCTAHAVEVKFRSKLGTMALVSIWQDGKLNEAITIDSRNEEVILV